MSGLSFVIKSLDTLKPRLILRPQARSVRFVLGLHAIPVHSTT